MRYYTVASNDEPLNANLAIEYECDHPVYSRCTLYKINKIGLAVIQQYYDPKTKMTWWGPIYSSLVSDIRTHPDFMAYFNSIADRPVKGIFPTVSVRQIMWALRMKPLAREQWETVFDKSPI